MKKMIGTLTALLVSVSLSMAVMGDWTDLGHFLKDAGQTEETDMDTETETETDIIGYLDEIIAKTSVEDGYRIVVMDEENRPLEGVVIQFCDEISCTVGVTDSEGNVVFEAPEGAEYEVHVLQAPQEYEKTDEIFKTADHYERVEIVLKQAK